MNIKKSILTKFHYNCLTLKNLSPYCPHALSPLKCAAFTMAEILISFTIIGIIAAITLPSLIGKINERTWSSQRKALYSRMTQALSMMPSLNGYGATGTQDEINQKAAQAFINDGLSKVLQINNICASTKLKDCGIPEKITVMSTNNKINFPTKLSELNSLFLYKKNPQKYIDTNVAAFETKNGVCVAVFYNPYCQSDMEENNAYWLQPKMCANFIFDLNAKKGPNKVGKDIGFITAIYATESSIVSPYVVLNNTSNAVTWPKVKHLCKSLDKESYMPSKEELAAIFYNIQMLNIEGDFWSGTSVSDNKAWSMKYGQGGLLEIDLKTGTVRLPLCVKKIY